MWKKWIKSHTLKRSYHMLHFTGHLQRGSSKQQSRTLITMAYSLHNVIIRALLKNKLWILRVSLTFNVNYLLIKKLNLYPVCIFEASVTHFPCMLTSVIITVECLTWLLVMYFAPPPNIWFDYQSNIARFVNSDSTMKILSRGHP